MNGAPFPLGVLAEELVVELELVVRVSLFEDEFEVVGVVVGVGVGELFADELLLEVVVGEDVNKGDGFIAMGDIETPSGAIRLCAPNSINDYGRSLYSALRSGDSQKLSRIVVIPPQGDGLAAAIRDRISRASA